MQLTLWKFQGSNREARSEGEPGHHPEIEEILDNDENMEIIKIIRTEMNEKMKLGLTLTPIEESIAGMRRVIDAKGLEESGKVWQWTGEPLDW